MSRALNRFELFIKSIRAFYLTKSFVFWWGSRSQGCVCCVLFMRRHCVRVLSRGFGPVGSISSVRALCVMYIESVISRTRQRLPASALRGTPPPTHARTPSLPALPSRPLACVTSMLSFAAPVNVAGKCGGSIQQVSCAAAIAASNDDETGACLIATSSAHPSLPSPPHPPFPHFPRRSHLFLFVPAVLKWAL